MPVLPFALYRYFDEGGWLLYVGISGDLPVRETAHIGRSRWMELTASSKIERYGTAGEVRAAEVTAVLCEQPLFNVQHNDTPEARERLRIYLEEIGRPDLLPVGQRRPEQSSRCADPWPDRGRRVEITSGVRTGETAIMYLGADASGTSCTLARDDGLRHHYLMVEDLTAVCFIEGAARVTEEDWEQVPWCSPVNDPAQCEYCGGSLDGN